MSVQQPETGVKKTAAVIYWAILILIMLFGIGSIMLFLLNRSTAVPPSWGHAGGQRSSNIELASFVTQSMWPVIGLIIGILIVRRYPRHRIGILLITVSMVSTLAQLVQEWAVFGYYTAPGRLPAAHLAAWITNWIWVVLFIQTLLLLVLFPNGRMLSRRWHYIFGGCLTVFALALLFGTAIEQEMSSAFLIPNPIVPARFSGAYDILFGTGVVALLSSTVVVLIATLLRYRQSTEREKRQMRWLFAGVIGFVTITVFGIILSLSGWPIGGLLVNNAFMLPVVGIGVGVLRHQLYDIDIIIRRTLLYSALSALLALLYFGSVILLQQLFGNSVRAESPIVIVLSTLMIAALFNPLRSRLQALIDRRFYRPKYDARQMLNRFAQTARDETDLTALSAALLDVIDETMQPTHLSLLLRTGRESRAEDETLGKALLVQIAARRRNR